MSFVFAVSRQMKKPLEVEVIWRHLVRFLAFNARIIEITDDVGHWCVTQPDLNRANTLAAGKDVKAPIFKAIEEWDFDGHIYGCGSR